jgi:hypothetical protein
VADNDEVVEMLRANLDAQLELVDAQNRTTRAVRALVLFTLIQVVAAVIATPFMIWGISAVTPGPIVIAAIVAIVGLIWALVTGWSELSLSEPVEECFSVPALIVKPSQPHHAVPRQREQFDTGKQEQFDPLLRQKFESLGPLVGQTYEAISSVAGQPSRVNHVGEGVEIVQWRTSDYEVVLQFDEGLVCDLVISQSK